MTLDEKVLAEVLDLRTQVDELEDKAWEARARFHQAVRRLHRAGGSLREIAIELGMSHQRVHQIIGEEAMVEVETTGTELVPRDGDKEDACAFCESPAREVDRMLSAPGPTFVCAGCIVRARQALDHGTTMRAGNQLLRKANAADAACTFCRNDTSIVGPMVERSDASVRICRSCLEACERMLAPTGQYSPKGPAMKRRSLVRCSFCNVSQKDTKKLIAGPGVYICEVCIAAATAVVAGAPTVPSRAVTLRPNRADCAFCGKSRAQLNEVVGAGRGRICNECLDLCHDTLQEETKE